VSPVDNIKLFPSTVFAEYQIALATDMAVYYIWRCLKSREPRTEKNMIRKLPVFIIFICLISINAYGAYWLNSIRPSADYESDYNGCRGMQTTPDDSKTKACLMRLGWCPVTKDEIKRGANCGMGQKGSGEQRNVVLKEFNGHYMSVEVGMSKKQVDELMGIETTDKVAASTQDGVLECWSWSTQLGIKSILFKKGPVAQIGISSCLDFM